MSKAKDQLTIMAECVESWKVAKGDIPRWPNNSYGDTYDFRRKFKGILYYTIDVKLGPEVYQQFEIPNIANGKTIFSSYTSLCYAIEYFLTNKFSKEYFPQRKMTKLQAGIVNQNDIDYDIIVPLITDKKDCDLHTECGCLFLWKPKNKQPKLISNPKFRKGYA